MGYIGTLGFWFLENKNKIGRVAEIIRDYMKNHTAAAPKKSRLTTNLIIAVFMLSIIGLAAWNLPRGYSVDLTLIGKGFPSSKYY